MSVDNNDAGNLQHFFNASIKIGIGKYACSPKQTGQFYVIFDWLEKSANFKQYLPQ